MGSAREEPGRSGFAHLFEHMMFQGSQHVGDDQHFKLIQEAGGTLNGTTNRDRTNYFETLPANQLELALWLEADRMGFLLPAMTQEKLDNQREVVKNERRQSYENRPYGLVSEVVARNLYPEGHPYSWTTIGSMEDLDSASLEDVREWFRTYYGAANAVIVVAGVKHPLPAVVFGEVCATSDIPAGVVNILTAHRDELIPPLAEHRDVNAIGGANLEADECAALRRGTAENLKRVRLETIDTEAWYDDEARASVWRPSAFSSRPWRTIASGPEK